MRIYQLFVRLFGNMNETRKEDGTIEENGVGKFNDINDAALKSLHELGFTHIWLTGVLQQATATDYLEHRSAGGRSRSAQGSGRKSLRDQGLLRCLPRLRARSEEHGLTNSSRCSDRIHKHGMKAMIDFVPNHVARSYDSDVKPDSEFRHER